MPHALPNQNPTLWTIWTLNFRSGLLQIATQRTTQTRYFGAGSGLVRRDSVDSVESISGVAPVCGPPPRLSLRNGA